MTTLRATVVITTKDRKDDLRNALKSSLLQDADPEIIVIDDASTDGTSDMVPSEFPTVRYIRHQVATGYIVGRNEAARLASGDVIFSIDDDAIFTTSQIISDTLSCFDGENIGAVAIPYVDVNKSPTARQAAPDANQVWLADRFIGTAHAVRRDVFLQVGGYRECYFHQGEERDFCLRMLDAGYFVRLGNCDVIHHFESPNRDTKRMDIYGRRNDVLVAWLNFPLTVLPVHIIGTTIKGLIFGLRVGRPLRMLQGLVTGYGAIWTYFHDRAPIKVSTYRRFRNLQTAGPLPAKKFL